MTYNYASVSEDNHLAMYWNTFKQTKLSEGVKEYTLEKYLICLRKFNDWLFVSELEPSPTSVRLFLVHLQDKDLSAFRVRNYWVSMMSFYTWAYDQQYITENPMDRVKAPKLPKRTIEIFTDQEVHALLDSSSDNTFETVITTFWKTGIRGSELLQIKNKDVNIDLQTIHIHGKGSKDRKVPFDNKCAQLIEPILQNNQSSHIFPTNLNQIRKTLKFHCLDIGINYRGPHTFRHTFACNYLKAGGSPLDLMYILGHSTLAMVNHYSQWLASDRAIENYHKIFATN
ncbi:MAG: tyrosine-type recombinase/integrase [Planctomycetes bacterium]|nr:tyrosine-type recombinase/integrase [Planctomycetota bacterium]